MHDATTTPLNGHLTLSRTIYLIYSHLGKFLNLMGNEIH